MSPVLIIWNLDRQSMQEFGLRYIFSLIYRKFINIFQLDKCVDGKLSCYGCNDEFDFDPLPGNTADPPIKLPHNPKPTPWGSSDNLKPDFLNKPPPKGTKPPRPDAPTLPPQARINVSLISNYLLIFE